MVLLLRALARLVGFLLLVALAVAGLAAAVFSLQGGDGSLSLPGLVRLVSLDDLSATVGTFLAGLEGGGTHTIAALSGAGAVALAIGLLVGTLVARRERLVVVRRDSAGVVAARRRAVAETASALAEQPRDVLRARAKVRPHRRSEGARLLLTAYHARTASRDAVKRAARSRLEPIEAPFSLRAKVRGRLPRRGGRVR